MSINLSRTSAAARAQQRRDKMFTRGIWIAIVILLIVGGAYGALRVYNNVLKGNIDAADNKINLLEAKMSEAKTVQVANAIFRSRVAQKYDTTESTVLALLERLSAATVDAVTMDRYDYTVSKKAITINVDMTTTDLLAIARQIAALKQAEVFRTVTVKDVNRNQDTGNVQFTIVLSYDRAAHKQ